MEVKPDVADGPSGRRAALDRTAGGGCPHMGIANDPPPLQRMQEWGFPQRGWYTWEVGVHRCFQAAIWR